MTIVQCSAPHSTTLPFYTKNDSIRLVAHRWGDDSSVSVVAHDNERHFLGHIYNQCPPVIIVGAERSLLKKRIIAEVNTTENRPIIVALVETADEALLTECYRQGADRVVVLPFCSSKIFEALLKNLLTHDDDYSPYRIDASIQTFKFGKSHVRLTKKPFDLAQYLFLNYDRLIPKSTILQDVWGLDSEQCTTRRIEVHMTRVRRELALDGTFGWDLQMRRKLGYGIFKRLQD